MKCEPKSSREEKKTFTFLKASSVFFETNLQRNQSWLQNEENARRHVYNSGIQELERRRVRGRENGILQWNWTSTMCLLECLLADKYSTPPNLWLGFKFEIQICFFFLRNQKKKFFLKLWATVLLTRRDNFVLNFYVWQSQVCIYRDQIVCFLNLNVYNSF